MERTHSFGYWLRRRRKALDLTQADLALRVSCSLDLIRKIEADARRPSKQLAERLATSLGLDAAERVAFVLAARAEWAVDRLALPAQPSDPPALNALGARRTNLPAQPTALLGREREIATITTLLRRSEVRLITLTGPGGIGKTRLGIQVAAELAEERAHGAYLVDLSPIRDSSLVGSAIAQTLGVRDSGGQPLLATLHEYLRDKHMLLLLDNFEHLLDAAPLVAQLLGAAKGLKVLVTSRELLHLRGEKELVVQPLVLPDSARLPPLEQLSQYSAVALLIERALDAQPDFALTHANAPAVAEICTRLDGLPLAIELAAARLKLFTPEALLARLSRRLPVLTNGPRDLPARQQTIRSTIAWSYDLLSETEQTLFRRLGVFVGGCTPEAASAVLRVECLVLNQAHNQLNTQNSELNILEGLAALVDKSLLGRVEGADGEPRFVMLETMREYALERLEASGEAQQLRQQHARYYLGLSGQGAPNYKEFIDTWVVHRLDREYDNLQAALGWSYTSDAALALQLSRALISLWRHRGAYHDAIDALKRGLEQLSPSNANMPTDTLAQIRGYMRQTLANLLAGTCNFSAARLHYEQLLLQAREQSDPQLAGVMLERIGWLAREQGDCATAWEWMKESLALFRTTGDTAGVASTLVSMAGVAIVAEEPARAEALLTESGLLDEHAPADARAWALNHLGNVAQLRGDYARAVQLHRDSLAHFPGNYHAGIRSTYHSLGESLLGLGQRDEAARWLRQALALSQRLSASDCIAWCLAGLGSVAALAGQPERAARLWGAAKQLRQAIGCRPPPAARATYERAQAVARTQLGGDTFAAAWAAGQALTLNQAVAYALEEQR